MYNILMFLLLLILFCLLYRFKICNRWLNYRNYWIQMRMIFNMTWASTFHPIKYVLLIARVLSPQCRFIMESWW